MGIEYFAVTPHRMFELEGTLEFQFYHFADQKTEVQRG